MQRKRDSPSSSSTPPRNRRERVDVGHLRHTHTHLHTRPGLPLTAQFQVPHNSNQPISPKAASANLCALEIMCFERPGLARRRRVAIRGFVGEKSCIQIGRSGAVFDKVSRARSHAKSSLQASQRLADHDPEKISQHREQEVYTKKERLETSRFGHFQTKRPAVVKET